MLGEVYSPEPFRRGPTWWSVDPLVPQWVFQPSFVPYVSVPQRGQQVTEPLVGKGCVHLCTVTGTDIIITDVKQVSEGWAVSLNRSHHFLTCVQFKGGIAFPWSLSTIKSDVIREGEGTVCLFF